MLKLLNAYSAEQQAIAIYKSQSFWRRGPNGNIFREVLAEEESHQQSIDPFISWRWLFVLITPFNYIAGWMVGTVLSMLPRGLCYRIHVWAERDAAKTYESTLKSVGGKADPALQKALSHAARQEYEHASRFERLVKVKKFD